ncbi:MAG: hypothetical protein LC112_14020 [Flavobacteriales bacterium]|nr:hypothetical protein [Flavobacteriales bacterium]
MQSINNKAILGYCCNCAGDVLGKASYSYDSNAGTLTVTDQSQIPATDTFKVLHVDVYDRFGNKAYGTINAAGGNVVINVAGLNSSRGFAVSITVVTGNGIGKDGSAFINVAATQNSGQFNVEDNPDNLPIVNNQA